MRAGPVRDSASPAEGVGPADVEEPVQRLPLLVRSSILDTESDNLSLRRCDRSQTSSSLETRTRPSDVQSIESASLSNRRNAETG